MSAKIKTTLEEIYNLTETTSPAELFNWIQGILQTLEEQEPVVWRDASVGSKELPEYGETVLLADRRTDGRWAFVVARRYRNLDTTSCLTENGWKLNPPIVSKNAKWLPIQGGYDK
jgi:hypothetical protein